MRTALRVANNGAGRAEGTRQRSPVSIPAASPKAALHAFTAEGGGSFAAPTGHALSVEMLLSILKPTGLPIPKLASDEYRKNQGVVNALDPPK